MSFGSEFQDTVVTGVVSQERLEELRLLPATMEEMIEVRHLASPRSPLFRLLKSKLDETDAPLYEWCNLADSVSGAPNQLDTLALKRIRSVAASRGEIESAIGNRHPTDKVRKALEKRLKASKYDE